MLFVKNCETKLVSAKLCAAEICKGELNEFHFRTHLFRLPTVLKQVIG